MSLPITNAMLLRIDNPIGSQPDGNISFMQGPPICIECCMDQPNDSERFQLGATIREADATLFVDRDDVGAGAIIVGQRIMAQMDGEPIKSYQVISFRSRILNGLEHYEAFLKSE